LKDAETAFASKVQKLQTEHDAHISGWKAKVASHEQECKVQLAKAVAGAEQKLQAATEG